MAETTRPAALTVLAVTLLRAAATIALVLGQGRDPLAIVTCLAAVVVAAYSGNGTAYLLDRIPERTPHPIESDSYTF